MTASRRSWLWGAVLLAALAAIGWQLLAPPAGGVADPHADEARERVDWLAPDGLESATAFELFAGGRRHRFERDAAGGWFVHADHAATAASAAHPHTTDPAAAQRIAQTLATFGRTRIERTVSTDPARRGRYGLDNPPLIVIVYGAQAAGPMLTLEAGDVAPDGLTRYAFVRERNAIVALPNYQVEQMRALLPAR